MKPHATLYRPLWEGIQSALAEIFANGRPADKVIQFQLKANRKWGSHDRRLFAEAVYDLVRWWRKLLHVCGVDWPAEDGWSKADREVFALAIAAWCRLHDVELDRAISVSKPPANLEHRWRNPDLPRAVAQSIPNWLDDFGAEQLGARWDEILPVLNTVAPVYLRANRLQITPEKLEAELRAEKVELEAGESDSLKLTRRANVFLTKSFTAGHFEVQDLHSQRVVSLLNPQPGQRVIDACAGAGGKSLHLASLMGNKGKIIALDVSDKKLEQLRERSTRARATSIETRVIEGTKTIKRLHDSAERVLLDVPCSGLGVLRRNPDAKWKLKRAEIDALLLSQAEILASYSCMCKSGGLMVYATCSIMPAENEHQIARFLSQNNSEWKLESEKTLFPEVNGGDGFYLASLRRS
jgi:16S rRNA (cytosine967-C5)-methyltransferase